MADQPVFPAEVNDINDVPPEYRDHFGAKDWTTGKYPLVYIHDGDTVNLMAHVKSISAGKVTIFPAGETRASMAEREAQRATMQTVFEQELARLEREADDQRRARLEAKQRADRERLENSLLVQRRGIGR
jgi:hypothetical protein